MSFEVETVSPGGVHPLAARGCRPTKTQLLKIQGRLFSAYFVNSPRALLIREKSKKRKSMVARGIGVAALPLSSYWPRRIVSLLQFPPRLPNPLHLAGTMPSTHTTSEPAFNQ